MFRCLNKDSHLEVSGGSDRICCFIGCPEVQGDLSSYGVERFGQDPTCLEVWWGFVTFGCLEVRFGFDSESVRRRFMIDSGPSRND